MGKIVITIILVNIEFKIIQTILFQLENMFDFFFVTQKVEISP